MNTKSNAQKIQEWRDAHPGARLNHAALRDLVGANLSRANLRWANLTGADLFDADLSGADLFDANLSGADLSWADLSWADLSGANLIGADLSWADLSWADLSGANLIGADLFDANLSGADKWGGLRWADLRWADRWGGLRLDGLASGQVTMVPTPNGWVLSVGCWSGTVDELEALASGDEGWPEAVGEERERRRPGLLALVPVLRAHQEYHHDKLVVVQEKWGNDYATE